MLPVPELQIGVSSENIIKDLFVVQLDSLCYILNCLLVISQLAVDNCPAIPVLRLSLLYFDGPGVVFKGLLVLLHIHQAPGPVGVISSNIVLDLDGFCKILNCTLLISQSLVRNPSVVEEDRVLFSLDGFGVVFNCLFCAANIQV